MHSLRRVPLETRKATAVLAIALVMASAFAAAYTVALGRPFPRHFPIGVVGPPSTTARIVNELQIRSHEFDVQLYPSREASIAAVNRQEIPAVIDASTAPPQLLVPSASDPSSARVLTQLDQPAPGRYLLPVVGPASVAGV